MAEWGLYGGNRFDTYGENALASSGTQLAYTQANTKGGWNQIISSTAFDANALWVWAYGETSGADFLVDVGIGGSGSEVVLIQDLMVTGRDNVSPQPTLLRFPVSVPAGSRLCVRYQSSASLSNLRTMLMIEHAGGLWAPGFRRITAYGINAGDSGAVSVDPGGSTNTKGDYSEIEDVTASPIRLMWVALGLQANTARTDASFLFDVAIGAAGSEQIILPDLWTGISAGKDIFVPQFLGPFPVNLPAGVRLAVRAQCSITDASDRLADVAIYGAD